MHEHLGQAPSEKVGSRGRLKLLKVLAAIAADPEADSSEKQIVVARFRAEYISQLELGIKSMGISEVKAAIALGISAGMTSAEVGGLLSVSKESIQNALSVVYDKLGLHSQVMMELRRGLVYTVWSDGLLTPEVLPYLTRNYHQFDPNKVMPPSTTPVWWSVWEGVARGMNNTAISASLGLDDGTARNRITMLNDALGTAHDVQAMLVYYRWFGIPGLNYGSGVDLLARADSSFGRG